MKSDCDSKQESVYRTPKMKIADDVINSQNKNSEWKDIVKITRVIVYLNVMKSYCCYCFTQYNLTVMIINHFVLFTNS